MNLPESKYINYSPDGAIILPNIKKIFLADAGMEIADVDLSGADIQVVAWDSGCKWLIDYFNNPRGCGKVYAYLASEYLQREISPKSDEYKVFKACYHSTNYKVGVEKIMSMTGLSRVQAQGIRDHYFRLCPEVRLWQDRLETEVKKRGYTRNAFGRRMWFKNTNNPNLMNEVTASVPQSTIGDVINRAWCFLRKNYAKQGLKVSMQTHDSLTLQYPIAVADELRPKILEGMKIVIPYPQPLVIPSDMKISRISYGHTEKWKNYASAG